jgi:phosphoribosyl-ATP pyrophosphohydrolase
MATMIDRLQLMLDMQRELQFRINGYKIEEQDLAQRVANVSLNVLACTDELHEALNETSWKPWADSEFINDEALKKELIDVWHFLMNLFLHAGMEADEIMRRYAEKHAVNLTRQDVGYDGIAGKCPNCRRDLADVETREVHAKSSPRIDIHCVCGAYLGSRAV